MRPSFSHSFSDQPLRKTGYKGNRNIERAAARAAHRPWLESHERTAHSLALLPLLSSITIEANAAFILLRSPPRSWRCDASIELRR